MPPSSVSGAAPWQWLWQRVGASKWPPAPRRQFTKHVDLRAATFGCGSSFLAVLDPSAAFPAVLRARSAVVFAGLRLVVGVWAETRQILWMILPSLMRRGTPSRRHVRTHWAIPWETGLHQPWNGGGVKFEQPQSFARTAHAMPNPCLPALLPGNCGPTQGRTSI